MYRIANTIIAAVVIMSSVSSAGIFDRLKRAGEQAIHEKIDEKIDEQINDEPQKQSIPKSPDESQMESGQEAMTIQSVEDLYGYWEGRVAPEKAGLMDAVSLQILITRDFAAMKAAAAGSRCLAELKPAEKIGVYQADILDDNSSWGTRATVTFHQDGSVDVDWIDAPDTPSDKRLYSGQIRKLIHPYTPTWSASPEQRKAFDIVGFVLGMTYEEARDFCETDHADLEPALNLVKDEGTVSIIYALKQKGAKKVGSDVFGEQITLGFQSQTPAQMQVEQDPAVLAKIKEREALIEKRNEMIQNRNAQRRRSRESSVNNQSELPEIPPMPKLRPEGADAELMFVSRQLMFGGHQGPHRDKVIQALCDKYSSPSIQIDDTGSYGGRIKLAWIYDLAGTLMSDAADGPCDHLTQQPSPSKDKEKFYSVALRAAQAGGPYDLVTISPQCGLTAKAQLSLNPDGSAYQVTTTVYDPQRLLADDWYRIMQFHKALIAEKKAEAKAIESRDVPDF